MRFYWVIEGALAGSSMPRDTRSIGLWREAGVRAVLSLVEEWELEEAGWDPSTYFGLLRRLGMDVLHAPTQDGHAPRDLEALTSWIGLRIGLGTPVVVHCGGGIGRSPTVIAAYLVSRCVPLEEALSTIHRANPDMYITDEQYYALRAHELDAQRKCAGHRFLGPQR